MNMHINSGYASGQTYNPCPTAPLNPYAHQQQGAAVQIEPPPAPTRFSNCAGRLEAQVTHLAGLVDRVNRVTDRLGGAIPEAVAKDNKLRGGGCVAGILEASLDDFDAVTQRLNALMERLEAL